MRLQSGRFPFYVGIATLVTAIVILLTVLFLWVSHHESSSAAIQMADRLFSEINDKTLERYENSLGSVAMLAGSIARMPGMNTRPIGGGLSHPGLELMLESLSHYGFLFSTYIGYADGSFIQVVAVRDDPSLRKRFDAPPGTAYVLRTTAADVEGRLQQRWLFLNADRRVTAERFGLDPDYDPRTRPWYVRAMREQGIFFTQPYIFSATQIPGITCAEQLHGQDGVFGADITLDRFSLSLERQKVSDNGMLFLFDREGRIVVHPAGNVVAVQPQGRLSFLPAAESNDPRIRAVVADYQGTPEPVRNRTREIMIDGVGYLVRTAELKDRLKLGQTLASIAPVSDFTSHIRRMRQRIFLFSVMVLLAVLPLALMISRKISWSLTRLEGESVKIRHRDFSASEPFDSRIKEIHSLNLAFDLMKSTIRDYTDRLIQARRDIERLFSAVTELIAGAIDAKSPYTGGHCKRVPEIARLLAAAAHESGQPPFADFHMDTEDQWREFEVAAWLHDCGKLTTPEYVVDKATKLETIYNRIHEIRMRFEVLLRDVEIDAYRRRLSGEIDAATFQQEVEEARREIVDDFAFVAECNIGGEFMGEEKIDRLSRIAARTWLRHLDDRLGISHDEIVLKAATPAPALPVREPLLADKPEHIVPRSDPDPFGDNPYGFKMEAPAHQYNLGEIYNLSIRKGTLSAEDRFKINEHIIQTIVMLKRLPFPENMKHVPDIAGSHHETMNGTGYPRALKKADMSIPERIMAIADIFEALTAADRPYQKPKSLSEALHVMSVMRDDQHIDADLFDLFLQSGVYRRYAERYLDPAQADEVDIESYQSDAGT